MTDPPYNLTFDKFDLLISLKYLSPPIEET